MDNKPGTVLTYVIFGYLLPRKQGYVLELRL